MFQRLPVRASQGSPEPELHMPCPLRCRTLGHAERGVRRIAAGSPQPKRVACAPGDGQRKAAATARAAAGAAR